MDPNLRNKIKDNLTSGQRKALQDIQKNFSQNDIRIRKEDKGSRFVIVDRCLDDSQIQANLGNTNNYAELVTDPTPKFINNINYLFSSFE